MALTKVLETKLVITKKCNYNNFLGVPLGKIHPVTVHRLLSNFQSVPHYIVSNMFFLTPKLATCSSLFGRISRSGRAFTVALFSGLFSHSVVLMRLFSLFWSQGSEIKLKKVIQLHV